jgi:multiple sugar transport system permease protein
MAISVVKSAIKKVVIYAVAAFILMGALFPIIWLGLTSIKTTPEILTTPPLFIFQPTLSNFQYVVDEPAYLNGLINSLVVTTSALVVGLVVGLPAAYALARFDFRRKSDLEGWYLSMRFLPPIAVVIPFYAIWVTLHLYDTYYALIISYSLISLPYVVVLMTQYFRGVPLEIEEASMLDGCSPFASFTRIVLPNIIPALISAATLIFILMWDEFFFAFLFTQHRLTLPVTVAAFATITVEIPWGQIAAAASLLVIPAVLLTVLFRRVISYLFLVGGK